MPKDIQSLLESLKIFGEFKAVPIFLEPPIERRKVYKII
jgi:hypothetical protein